MQLDHIGIAVKSLATSNALFAKLLGVAGPYKSEEVASEGVTTSFFNAGASKVELLFATSADSAIGKFIENRGEGIHHIAFAVESIEKEIQRLKAEGFDFVAEKPKIGADQKLICFLHPQSTNGVLIELCQTIG